MTSNSIFGLGTNKFVPLLINATISREKALFFSAGIYLTGVNIRRVRSYGADFAGSSLTG